jgi:hypothetical protein
LVLKVLADSCYILRSFSTSVKTLAIKKNGEKEIRDEIRNQIEKFENHNVENILIEK